MCAICGFVTTDSRRVPERANLLAMRDTMVARGPDDAGDLIAPGVALGSRRLAILDLSAHGHMPMASPGGRYWIVHNGEIYNYRELRARLAGQGYVFRSDSDTEVLLAAFIAEGPAMLDRLNGMFAFAVWDQQERRLFLARDRLGVKPLHWALHDGTLFFASEPKALFAAGVPCEFDPGSWSELLLFRYVAGSETPYRGVHRLLPGHLLAWREGRVEIRKWWDLAQRIRARRESAPAGAEEYMSLLRDAVAMRLISDVPVGILLSGGLDSSAVAALAAETRARELGAFTCRFAESGFDEGPVARSVAERHGLAFHERFVSPEELLKRLVEATRFQDEPLAHSSHLHMMAVSELAKPNATVLLSGEGADEMLGGYERYRPLRVASFFPLFRAVLGALPPGLVSQPRIRKLRRMLAGGGEDFYLNFNACEVLPEDLEKLGFAASGAWEYRAGVVAEAHSLYQEPFRRAMFVDQNTFLVSLLDRNDRMTMAASIECRVPFLDFRLVELAGALPTKVLFWRFRGKGLLRRAMRDRLPDSVVSGRKWGFGVPWARYFRDVPELRSVVEGLSNGKALRDGPLDRGRLRKIVRAFLDGNDEDALLIQELVMIAIWYEVCIEGASMVAGLPRAPTPRFVERG